MDGPEATATGSCWTRSATWDGAAGLLIRLRRLHRDITLVWPTAATPAPSSTAERERFEAGDFDSCTTAGAIGRLRDIAGVAVGDKPAKSLAVLARWRNRLQHYGLTAPAPAVEVTAAQVLDFLVTFVYDELLPALPGPGTAAVFGDLEAVGTKVRGIKSYMATRVERLADELKDVQERTATCPVCEQWALVIGEGADPLDSRFCRALWEQGFTSALEHHHEEILGLDGTVQECHDCHEHALPVEGAGTAAAPAERRNLCFCCGTDFDVIAGCSDCLNAYVPAYPDDIGWCPDCTALRIDRF
ncbi:hypothetical protein [Streptomyces sp. NBC_01276]|uniref:hypothetical protein n=1 Tax=Streptomyces sp. NBC_01276 TaxID=2903808 RepID=UPI002F9179A3